MSENTSTTHSAPASDASSNANAVALTVNNNSTLNPSAALALPPSAGPAAAPNRTHRDAFLLRTAEFVERIETRVDPLGTQRRRLAEAARTHKPWKPARLNAMRHARKCRICNHPRREEIESDYLSWMDPAHISCHYYLRNDSSIYRHPRAVGLDKKRRNNLRGALESILQRSHSAAITATGVVAAVRAYTSLDDRSGWVEPTRHTVVTHVNSVAPAQAEPQPRTSSSPRRRRFAPRPTRRPGKRTTRGISAKSKRGARRNTDRNRAISNRLANRQPRSQSK
jgi:hypothetical protein